MKWAAFLMLVSATTAHAHVTGAHSQGGGRGVAASGHYQHFGAETDLPLLHLDVELVNERFDATSAWDLRLRPIVVISGPLYVGIELDAGGLTRGPGTLVLGARAVTGVRDAITPTLALSAELAGGVRVVETATTTGVVEARGRIDWWATPHLTVGASIGTSLIDLHDHSFTVGFGGHIHAFSRIL